MLSPINNLHGKSITESKNRQNFDNAHPICNLHLCYNFALVSHKLYTRFQPIRNA